MARRLENKSEHKGLSLDEWDLKNLRRGIQEYDAANPRGKVRYLEYDKQVTDPLTKEKKTVKGQMMEFCNIGDHLEWVKGHLTNKSGFKNLAKKGFDDPIVLRVSLPPELYRKLIKGYPQLFNDNKQLSQFLKAFPAFDLAKR